MASTEETGSEIRTKRISKKRPIRTRRKSSDNESEKEEDEDEEVRKRQKFILYKMCEIIGQNRPLHNKKLCDMKALQKLRERPSGINVAVLISGEKNSDNEEEICKDSFKAKAGGMVNMKTLKSNKMKPVDDAYETGIGTQFSAETNKRDEDEEMMKYIEEQLSKKKGHLQVKKQGDKNEDKHIDQSQKYYSPEDAALLAVPDNLRASSTQRSEEMLSNQMLSGIPEVDLGIDAKIRNIEATEEAKLKLIWNKHNKNDGPSQFVPSNITVNFMQQNKMNADEGELRKFQWKIKESYAQRQGSNIIKSKEGEKATDDYHYERFKKQFKRY